MRIIYTFALLFLSLCLYATFGVFCGVAYKALSVDVIDSNFESSPVLYNFINDKDAESVELHVNQIQSAVVYIILKNASKNTKAGNSIVLPSLPIVNVTDTGISVSFPVYINTMLGRLATAVIFDFSTDKKITFKGLKIGNAKIPDVFHKIISNIVLSYYNDVFGNELQQVQNFHVVRKSETFKFSK